MQIEHISSHSSKLDDPQAQLCNGNIVIYQNNLDLQRNFESYYGHFNQIKTTLKIHVKLPFPVLWRQRNRFQHHYMVIIAECKYNNGAVTGFIFFQMVSIVRKINLINNNNKQCEVYRRMYFSQGVFKVRTRLYFKLNVLLSISTIVDKKTLYGNYCIYWYLVWVTICRLSISNRV